MTVRLIPRLILLGIALTALSGCGCMLDPGDSTNVSDYWHGCWGEAKGNPYEE